LLLAPLRAQMHAYLATVLKNQDSPAFKVGRIFLFVISGFFCRTAWDDGS
jgi:hypothetical protein